MNAIMNKKRVLVTAPAAIIDNASLTCTVVDTKGWDFVEYVVLLGATDIALTACKLQEAAATSSATALTSGADITGLVYGTSTNTAGSTSALPTSTDDNKFFSFQVNMANGSRKRYLNPVITVGDGTAGGYVTVWAELSRGESTPYSASTRGYDEELRV